MSVSLTPRFRDGVRAFSFLINFQKRDRLATSRAVDVAAAESAAGAAEEPSGVDVGPLGKPSGRAVIDINGTHLANTWRKGGEGFILH